MTSRVACHQDVRLKNRLFRAWKFFAAEEAEDAPTQPGPEQLDDKDENPYSKTTAGLLQHMHVFFLMANTP